MTPLEFSRGGVVGSPRRLAAIAFGALLLLAFIGVTPFKPSINEWQATDGGGNVFRQILYGFIFSAIVILCVGSRWQKISLSIPIATLSVVAWIFLSTLWSVSPDITLRRCSLVAIVVFSIFLTVGRLGIRDTLRILRAVLAIVLVVDLVSIPMIAGATHPYQATIAWAGLHGHKNIAGAVAALSGLLFLYYALQYRSKVDMVLLALSGVFLIGTQSKTAIVLMPILSMCLVIYFACSGSRALRDLFRICFCICVVVFCITLIVYNYSIFSFLHEADTLSGRGRIWQVVLAYIPDHLWLGAGFGAFWEGSDPPARAYVDAAWLLRVGHAHNSYLEVLVGTGVIGLTLSVVAFIGVPLRDALKFRVPDGAGALAFAWLLFGIIGNTTKSQFLDRDRPEWLIIVLAIAILHHSVVSAQTERLAAGGG